MLSSVLFTSVELLEFGHFVSWREPLFNFVRVRWLQVDPVEAFSRSCLNMVSISAFVKNTGDFSNKLVDSLAADKLLALMGVVPWTSSSRICSITGGVGFETRI